MACCGFILSSLVIEYHLVEIFSHETINLIVIYLLANIGLEVAYVRSPFVILFIFLNMVSSGCL